MSQVNIVSVTTSPRQSPVQSPQKSRSVSPTNLQSEGKQDTLVMDRDGVSTLLEAHLRAQVLAQTSSSPSRESMGSQDGRRKSLLMGTDDDSNVDRLDRRRSSTFHELSFTEEDQVLAVYYEATGLSGMKTQNGSDDEGSVGGNQENVYGELSPLPNATKSILKNPGSRLSLDSNAGLSPDVVKIKLEIRNHITPSARPRLFEDGSPDVLKTASKILKEREAGHAAEKQELRSDLTGLRVAIASLNSEKEALVQQMSQLEAKIDDYESRLKDLSSQIQVGTLKLQAMEKKYAKTKAILTEQNNALASEVGSKQKEKEAIEKDLMALNAEKSFIDQKKAAELDKLEALYRGKIFDLEQRIRSLDNVLVLAQDEIKAQKEIAVEARTKQKSTAEQNQALTDKNTKLVADNRTLIATQATAVGEADRLRVEVQEQKKLVAAFQWMIANPHKDISEYVATNVALDVPVSTKVGGRLKFAATPEKVSSKAKGSVPFFAHTEISVDDDSKEELVVDVDKSTSSVDMSGFLPVHILTEDVAVTSSSNPRRESLESVGITGEMTLEQKRVAQAAEAKRLREQRKAARAENTK